MGVCAGASEGKPWLEPWSQQASQQQPELRPRIYVYDLPPIYNSRMLEYRSQKVCHPMNILQGPSHQTILSIR